MKTPILGCIADDFTGATDLASMLVRAGLRVIQCFGLPSDLEPLRDADAVVISLKSRSNPPTEAVEQSLAALSVLQDLGAERFCFKYCSTFDSTPQGNIGPVADALADRLQSKKTLFCPSFPENGRTVYCGHLFVNGVPLHESGMRNHPINPMDDSDLVRVLQKQSDRSVGLWKLNTSLPSDAAAEHLIVDAITDEDLRRVAAEASDHRLLTGGSAIAGFWARELLDLESPSESPAQSSPTSSERTVILAGSCSDATRAQIGEFAKSHPVYRLDASAGSDPEILANAALAWCTATWNTKPDEPLLICSGADPESVLRTQEAMGVEDSAKRIEQSFASIAQGLAEFGIDRLVVAGGETSGAVTSALNVRVVRIGNEIAPGVPWIHSLHPPGLVLALKSGNFGGPRFFFEVSGEA